MIFGCFSSILCSLTFRFQILSCQDEDGEAVEGLELQFTFNPSIIKYKDFLHFRALNPNDALPDLRPEIAAYVEKG